MANKHKFYVRNETNDGWVNILTDTNIVVGSDSAASGQFASSYLDEILVELKTLAGDSSAPGYAGEPVHIINTDDVISSTDETGSFSTRGGAAIAKSLWVGTTFNSIGNISTSGDISGVNVTGTGDISGVNVTGTGNVSGVDFIASGDVSGVNITGTGNVSGVDFIASGNASAVNVTASGLTSTDTLSVQTSVTTDLIPSVDGTLTLGNPSYNWNSIYADTVNADTVNSTSFSGTFTGTLNGNVVGNVSGNLDGDLIGSPTVTVTANTSSTTPTSGALVVEGGLGVAENVNIGGNLTVTGTFSGNGLETPWDAVPESIIPDTTSLYTIGTSLLTWSNVYSDTFTGNLVGDVTGDVTSTNITSGTITTSGDVTIGNNLDVSGNFSVLGSFQTTSLQGQSLIVTGSNNSTSKDSGAVILTNGGMGIEQDLYVGGQGNFGTLDVTGLTTLSDINTSGALSVNGTLDVNSTTTNFNTLTTFNDLIKSTNTTNSTSVTTGALVVDGGVGIGQDLYVGGSLYLGGAWDGDYSGNFSGNFVGDLSGTFTGDLVAPVRATSDLEVLGDLTVWGTSTTINTETLTVKDNMMVLNSGLTGTPPSSLISGIEVNRGTSDNYRFMFRESDSSFRIGTGYLTVTVNDSTGFGIDELVTDLTTGATGTIILIDGNDLSINQTTFDADFVAGNTLEGTSSTTTITNVVDQDLTQAIATREDAPLDTGIAVWDATNNMFVARLWDTLTDLSVLAAGYKYLSPSGVTSVDLPPTPSEGQTVVIHDEENSWFDNPLVVGRNGNTIMGSSEDLVLNVNGSTVELVYSDVQGWRII